MRRSSFLVSSSIAFVVLVLAAEGCQAGSATGFAEGGADAATNPDPQPVEGGAGDSATTTDAKTDTSSPIEGSGVYYVACLTQLAGGRADRVFSFYGELTYTATATGGALQMKLTPLAYDTSTSGPPAKVSAGGKVGSTYTTTATVTSTGFFDAALGTVVIPGAANPITARDVTIEGTALRGDHGGGTFCSYLAGNVTQPVALTLDQTKNICLYFPVKDGDARPAFAAEDFVCSPP